MERIHKMIAVITLAEKAASEDEKAILGYDPKVWLETDAQICDMGQLNEVYSRVAPPPPVKCKRKCSHCCHLYIDIHKFIGNRGWPHPTGQHHMRHNLDRTVHPLRHHRSQVSSRRPRQRS